MFQHLDLSNSVEMLSEILDLPFWLKELHLFWLIYETEFQHEEECLYT